MGRCIPHLNLWCSIAILVCWRISPHVEANLHTQGENVSLRNRWKKERIDRGFFPTKTFEIRKTEVVIFERNGGGGHPRCLVVLWWMKMAWQYNPLEKLRLLDLLVWIFGLLKGREMVKELEPWKSYIENLPAGSLTIVCPFFKWPSQKWLPTLIFQGLCETLGAVGGRLYPALGMMIPFGFTTRCRDGKIFGANGNCCLSLWFFQYFPWHVNWCLPNKVAINTINQGFLLMMFQSWFPSCLMLKEFQGAIISMINRGCFFGCDVFK